MSDYERCIFTEVPDWCSTCRDGECVGLGNSVIACAINFRHRPLTKEGKARLLKLFKKHVVYNPDRLRGAVLLRYRRREAREAKEAMKVVFEELRKENERLVAEGYGKFVDGEFRWYKDQPDPETFRRDRALALEWTCIDIGLDEESPTRGRTQAVIP